jgi:hypothetical protein
MDADYYIKRRGNGMNRTHLIQRLEKPLRDGGVATPFSFGGGLVNGGLSKDAITALRGVFSFDYMGAAEFEFGSVPAALSRIARDRELFVTGVVQVKPDDVRVPFHGKRPDKSQEVYFIAHRDETEQVRSIITALAKNEHKMELKESCGLDRALCKVDYSRACGWLELNNGFMFFTDREMWERVKTMFVIGKAVSK